MRYYLLAGEFSGDMHAAGLIRAIKELDPKAEFRGMGGDLCSNEGMVLHRHYLEQNVMGFVEIVKHLPKLLRFLRASKKDLLEFKPDMVIPIDYPGFNLRIMKFAFRNNIPICYFIPPQVWAWHSSRAKSLAKCCKKLLCILPFEPKFYETYNAKAIYTGNPLVFELNKLPAKERKKNKVLLLPGSRPMEVKKTLPVMIEALKKFPGLTPCIGAVNSIPETLYSQLAPDIERVYGNTRELMQTSRIGLVCSGTATLEAALLGLPQIVCYAGNQLSVAIARKLIRVPYISLVNLIANKEIVKELIQDELTKENIQTQIETLLNTPNDIYPDFNSLLGQHNSYEKAANEIVELLS
jgi:lipid-A-disaccharide synthase